MGTQRVFVIALACLSASACANGGALRYECPRAEIRFVGVDVTPNTGERLGRFRVTNTGRVPVLLRLGSGEELFPLDGEWEMREDGSAWRSEFPTVGELIGPFGTLHVPVNASGEFTFDGHGLFRSTAPARMEFRLRVETDRTYRCDLESAPFQILQ